MRYIVIILLFCSAALAANDFSDASAVYYFESDGADIGLDTTANNNDLVNTGVVRNGTFYKQGSYSAEITDNATPDVLRLTEGGMTEFPLDSTSASQQMTVCFWVRFIAFPVAGDSVDYIMGKYDNSAANERTWMIHEYNTGATQQLRIFLGKTAGTTYDTYTYNYGSPLLIETWYHVAFTLDVENGTYKWWLRNEAGVLGTPVSTETAVSNAVSIRAGDFTIGNRDNVAADLGVNGQVDEVILWDRILTADEITNVFEGDYSPPAAGTTALILAH